MKTKEPRVDFNNDGPDLAHAQISDWFAPAILAPGSLDDCLTATAHFLEYKLEFLKQLRARLWPEGSVIDALTALAREVKELENTLRFRLGLLEPSRPAAWFREIPKRDFGPFRAVVRHDPVLAPYPAPRVMDVKSYVYDCWHSGTAATHQPFFLEMRSCLWFLILDAKARHQKLGKLAGPLEEWTLLTLVENLPDALESRGLRGFLLKVREEYLGVQDRLNICFDQLWTASEKLWAYQIQTAQARTTAHSQARTSSQAHTPPPLNLRLRFSEVEAMRTLGFTVRPERQDLRRRYLELAKQHHPDRTGGSEDMFKKVYQAYMVLDELIGRNVLV